MKKQHLAFKQANTQMEAGVEYGEKMWHPGQEFFQHLAPSSIVRYFSRGRITSTL